MGNERLLLGIIGVFGFLGISFFVAGGFSDSVGRGSSRGFRKYLNMGDGSRMTGCVRGYTKYKCTPKCEGAWKG